MNGSLRNSMTQGNKALPVWTKDPGRIKPLTAFLILSLLFSCASHEGQRIDGISGKDLINKDSFVNRGNSLPGSTRKDSINKDSFAKTDNSFPGNIGYYQRDGDSVIIPPFEIEVSLSAKANQKLTRDKETIIVAAYFTGQPKDTTSKEYLENGEIGITFSHRELNNSRIAKFDGIKFSKALFDLLADKDIQLLINIYSGRKSTNVNLLNCDILQDKMSNIKGKRFTLKGKLIYGD